MTWRAAVALMVTVVILGGSLAVQADADCLQCHLASSDTPVLAIEQTRHGAGGAAGAEGCRSCHGASDEHAAAPLDSAPSVSFGPHRTSSPAARDQACRNCHSAGSQTFWIGSVHHDEDVSCNGCHEVHTRHDQALDRISQSNICFACHTEVQASVRLRSRHPIQEGRTACVDCHNPHGSTTEAALLEPTLNDACYSCHAEKRGPFLFEHAPATEDCSLCHRPHGSVNDRLLTVRGPFLCQQCHSAAFHPSQLQDGDGLPGNRPSEFLLGRNCLNCHVQVHGTNHPSGARLTR